MEHPAPAADGADGVSREQLQEAKQRLLHVERELSSAEAQAAAARERGREASAGSDALGVDASPLEEQLHAALAEGKSLRAECDRLLALQAQRQELREAVTAQERQLEELERDREALQTRLQPLSLELAARSSRLEAELEAVPETLRDAAGLERMIAALELRCRQMEGALKAARDGLSGCASRLAECRARLEQLGMQAGEAAQARVEAEDRFRSEREQAGFASDEQYRNARMDDDILRQQTGALAAYRTELAAQRALVAELERELGDGLKQDLAALAAETDRLKRAKEDADAAWRFVQQCRERVQSLRSTIGDAARKYEESERALDEVADLHEMLKGDNALKISFERYILIEFLEQILHAANERLRVLSSGQFVLERSGRLEARGRQSGLGLDVYDSYTGQNRDVKSLSGGEKFNASLALALGMTDVIQSHQGGISIDMMFIDEGFGSLDEESLGRAISALADLQRTGRMIGVISHVQELKDAFPAVLEVTKTKEGHSRTRLVLK